MIETMTIKQLEMAQRAAVDFEDYETAEIIQSAIVDKEEILIKLEKFFKDALKKDWMTDDEYTMLLDKVFKHLGHTWDKLITVIQIGVKMGFSIDQQMDIVFKTLNNK